MERVLFIGLFVICAVIAIVVWNLKTDLEMTKKALFALLMELGYGKMFGEKGGTPKEGNNDE